MHEFDITWARTTNVQNRCDLVCWDWTINNMSLGYIMVTGADNLPGKDMGTGIDMVNGWMK